jgi:ammonium transporter
MFKRIQPALLALALLVCAASPALADDPPSGATAKPETPSTSEPPKLDSGHTAWMLVSTGLVMLMVPGLALFYGGMARRKNLLGTMMQSMVALAIIGVQWVLIGYCLAFGTSQGGWIGWDPKLIGLAGIDSSTRYPGTNIPVFVHCMYQGMFAIITPALISGALAERIRFGPYCLFILLWSTFVYAPLAHWVWAVKAVPTPANPLATEPAGWLGKLGALDFAGGTVVHIAAGMSGLAAILLLRKRLGYPEHAMHPNSVALTLLGGGLLWFGWFGFNGGSGLVSNGLAGAALTATQSAAAAAALTWMVVEWLHKGKPTALGFATGLVAGLVAVTPASGFVRPVDAMLIGVLATLCCYTVVALKPRLKYDDSLDAFGVHGVGGLVGALLTGVFASAKLYSAGSGSPDLPAITLFGGSAPRVLVQLVAALVACGFAFVIAGVLVKAIDLSAGFCLDSAAESEGLDRAVHGEVGFDLGLLHEAPIEREAPEPRPALVPPADQKRFTVVIEGGTNGDLMHVWSGLCQAGNQPPSPEFRAVYPHLTTVQGNRFRFRGGDPDAVRDNLQKLFEKRLAGVPLRVRLER